MRIKRQKENIQYNDTKKFFQNRAKKYQKNNPYSVTMYQDNNPALVRERNQKEVQKLLPKLRLSADSKILDIACGIGRWAEAIQMEIDRYCGIDFSGELIEIAGERNERPNFFFYEGSALEVEKVLGERQSGVLFNTILIMGAQIYFNDIDIPSFYTQVCNLCAEQAIICMREPIGIEDRLTLKEFFSDELQDDYNAIYRTRQEYQIFFEDVLFQKGFSVKDEGVLFEENMLNNRKETSQYYWIFER
ncbi:MAG: class I SAM-dependent methyltransferase [Lachnospiraceae bacterium]|nr:class I SAM-dependent methyltransferase [Lachnospiraceae bacterium]